MQINIRVHRRNAGTACIQNTLETMAKVCYHMGNFKMYFKSNSKNNIYLLTDSENVSCPHIAYLIFKAMYCISKEKVDIAIMEI